MWGKKKREKKRSRLFECLLLVKPLSFWSQNTRKEKNKIFSEKAKFSRFGGQIYIKSISRETSFLLSLVRCVRV